MSIRAQFENSSDVGVFAKLTNGYGLVTIGDPNDLFLGWVDDNDINFENLGLNVDGSNPWDDLKAPTINAALEMILSVAPTLMRVHSDTTLDDSTRLGTNILYQLLVQYLVASCSHPASCFPDTPPLVHAFRA